MLSIRKKFLALFVALVVITVFYPGLFGEIISVDDQQLLTNLLNTNSWSLRELFIPRGVGYYYRPLLYLSFLLDQDFWGGHESFMRLENIILHTANSVLVYFIADRMARHRKIDTPLLPLVIALLFGLHPLTTEPVNWISGRTDLMAGFFLFSGMLALLLWMDERRTLYLLIAAALAFTATLAKEPALCWYPAVLLFVFRYRSEQDPSPQSVAPRLLPVAVLSAVPAAYFVLRKIAFAKHDGVVDLSVKGVSVSGGSDLWGRLVVVCKAFGFYIRKLLVPLPLNFATVSAPPWYLPLGIAGVALAVLLVLRRSSLATLLLMGISIVAPAVIIPLGKMAWTPVAERYLYMPLAFVIIAAGTALWPWLQRRIPPFAGYGLVVILLVGTATVTYRRNIIWQHNLTLFEDCVRKSPNCEAAKTEFARALDEAGRHEEARTIYKSLNLAEGNKYRIVTEINRAYAIASEGNPREAVDILEKMEYTPDQPLYQGYARALLYLYGIILDKEQAAPKRLQIKKRIIALSLELQRATGDPMLFYRIGQLYLEVRQREDAIRYFRLAADHAPADAYYKKPARRLVERLEAETQ